MMKASDVAGALLIGALCLASPALAQHRPMIADQIAKTYGVAVKLTGSDNWMEAK